MISHEIEKSKVLNLKFEIKNFFLNYKIISTTKKNVNTLELLELFRIIRTVRIIRTIRTIRTVRIIRTIRTV